MPPSGLPLVLLRIAALLAFAPRLSVPASGQKIGRGYRLVSVGESPDGEGLLGYLQVKQTTNTYGPDIPRLKLFVKHETGSRLRVHMTDAQRERWEVPYDLLPREQVPPATSPSAGAAPLSAAEYPGDELVFAYESDPFGFAVRRKSDGQTLFDTAARPSDPYGSMVFKDQYLEISTRLPGDASLYGLGENTQPGGIRLRPNDPYTLYTTDISAINLNTDLYGSHPFYLDLRQVNGGEEAGSAHGVLLLNSNGMDVAYRGTSLTYKVIGGVLDFYFFAGATPLRVVEQYTALVGRPAPMPYWALGFHQCRWGYRNLSVVEGVVEGYKNAGIPLDVIWNDDDHMDAAKDFTLDPVSYPRDRLLAFLRRIHSEGMKYVVLIDPGIAVNATYGVYRRAMARDVFVKYEGEPYLAQVWPGPVFFPDFLNPDGVSWWADEVARFHRLVPVDGLWIDMNEASNFCTGRCRIPAARPCPDPNSTTPWVCCLDCRNITETRWDEPPYKINASGTRAPLGFKTIAASATHHGGVREYDAHSLYGLSQAVATHRALRGLDGGAGGRRPFILTRSTFVGSGAYAAHWTGDNKGTWEDLRYSISTVLNFGIFGMPMVGADICGFYPAPTEELCNRWIELGAFYPFSRDHANYYSPRQELYVWDSVAASARNALGLRYRLLPYLYTLSYEAHTTGAPIARPVFFSFPGFARAYGLSTQFLLGSSVMVSPVLDEGATSVGAVFPPGTWYNLFDVRKAVVSKGGGEISLDAPLNEINVHAYQNAILPMQQGGLKSREARATPFTLLVTFPWGAAEARAAGYLFVDDDERPGMELEEGRSTRVEFFAAVLNGTVKVWSSVVHGGFALQKGLAIERIAVVGLEGAGRGRLSVAVEGETLPDGSGARYSETPTEQPRKDADVNGERASGGGGVVVEISGLSLPLGKDFSVSWRMEVK